MYIRNKNGQVIKLDKPPVRENFRYKTRECYDGPLKNKPCINIFLLILILLFVCGLVYYFVSLSKKKNRNSYSFGYNFFK